ncbi:MAG: hypothetical protein IJN24_01545 [Bacteroidaceae bacterium]|nr:hypothetical protein [Bacteroidaceae bacterium]
MKNSKAYIMTFLLTLLTNSVVYGYVNPDSVSLQKVDSVSYVQDSSDSTSIFISLEDTIFVPKHFVVNELSPSNRALLISYYKSLINHDNSGKAYSEAYIPWKEAFNASYQRSIDLYADGVAVIVGTLKNDTAQHRYDRISFFTEQLMELYELAVRDVPSLNSMIDISKSKDTVSVAQLRARQIRYYRELWALDSIFNASHHNDYNENNLEYWNDVIFKDSVQILKMYPWYRDIALSDVGSVDLVHMSHFAKLLYFKIGDDKNVSSEYARTNFFSDKEVVEIKSKALFDTADPDLIIDAKRKITQDKYYASQLGDIEKTLKMGEGAFIPADDYVRLEKHYRERWEKEGDKVLAEVLTSNLAKSDSSVMYWTALRHKYESEPSYRLALEIAQKSCGKLKKYDDGISYFNKAMEYPEFRNETPYTQARINYNVYIVYGVRDSDRTRTKKSTVRQRYPYVKAAMLACPEYPEPYFGLAEIMAEHYSLSKKGIDEVKKRVYYCIAYDQLEIAKSRLKALNESGSGDVKSNLTMKKITDRQSDYSKNFPTREDLFMRPDLNEGQEYTLPDFSGVTYTTKVRASD